MIFASSISFGTSATSKSSLVVAIYSQLSSCEASDLATSLRSRWLTRAERPTLNSLQTWKKDAVHDLDLLVS